MVSEMINFIIIILVSLSLLSCIKEKAIELNYTEIKLPTELDLNDIYVENDSSIWIAAGKRFGRGAVFYSADFGVNWNIVLDYDHEIRSLRFKNGRIYAISIGNTLQWSDNRGQSWSSLTMPGWDYFSSADFFSDQSGILVGGENFGKGVLNKVGSGVNANFISSDTFQHELSDIQALNDSTLIAVGYGVILKSTDKGANWIPDNARGDFFKAITFSDSLNGYVIGDYGSIYKTTNAGSSWSRVKLSNTFFNNSNRFSGISFLNKNFGAICGRNGLLWITDNAADSWKPVSNLPDYDYKNLFLTNNNIILTSSAGKLLILNNP